MIHILVRRHLDIEFLSYRYNVSSIWCMYLTFSRKRQWSYLVHELQTAEQLHYNWCSDSVKSYWWAKIPQAHLAAPSTSLSNSAIAKIKYTLIWKRTVLPDFDIIVCKTDFNHLGFTTQQAKSVFVVYDLISLCSRWAFDKLYMLRQL